MNYLIYVEGYSEYNFVKIFLNHHGIKFTNDFNEIRIKGGILLKNCEGDTSIFPSLINDQWWIGELSDTLIIIILDLDKFSCYTSYKNNVQSKFKQLQIFKQFKVINSKPEIEQIYLENIKLLKDVIKGYYNQNSINKIKDFSQLKKENTLTDGCKDRFIIKTILKANNCSMSKREFSEKFFTHAIQQNISLSIITRLENIILKK